MRFDYHRPASLSDALEMLAEDGQPTRPILYGSDLIVMTKSGTQTPESVVDLTAIPELCQIESTKEYLLLGAGVSLGELSRSDVLRRNFPALHRATGTMGSVQLREGASLGGNICTASPAGDTGPALLCYDALMVAANTERWRDIPAAEFFTGPGSHSLERDEILLGVKLIWPPDGAVGTYAKGARRAAVDLALVSAAAVAWPDSAAPSGVTLRLALGAVAPTAVRAPAAEALAQEQGLAEEASSELGQSLAAAAREAAKPIDDVRATAAYRLTLVGELAARATAELARELAASAGETKE